MTSWKEVLWLYQWKLLSDLESEDSLKVIVQMSKTLQSTLSSVPPLNWWPCDEANCLYYSQITSCYCCFKLKNWLDRSLFFPTRLNRSLNKNISRTSASFSFLRKVCHTDSSSERKSQTLGQYSKCLTLDSFSTLLCSALREMTMNGISTLLVPLMPSHACQAML